MMPTRLQGTLSASLLQWLRSCEDDAVKYVEVRIVDGANVEETACALQNGGLEVSEKTLSAVRGRIKAKDLAKFMYMKDISVITEIRSAEKESR